MAMKFAASGPSRSTKRRRRLRSFPITRTGVAGPSIGTETPGARQGATAGNARMNASKRAGSVRPPSEESATGAPMLIENDALSPGKIATLIQPRSPATSPVVPRGARLRRSR